MKCLPGLKRRVCAAKEAGRDEEMIGSLSIDAKNNYFCAMTLTVIPKTKKEEKMVKAFLKSLSIGFYSEAEEDAALYKAMEKGRKTRLLKPKEKIEFLRKLKTAK